MKAILEKADLAIKITQNFLDMCQLPSDTASFFQGKIEGYKMLKEMIEESMKDD